MYTIHNEYIVTDDGEMREVMALCRNRRAYPENLISCLSLVFEDDNNVEKLIKKLRNAPPRSFSGNVVRYFSDFFGKILLDLEKNMQNLLINRGEIWYHYF